MPGITVFHRCERGTTIFMVALMMPLIVVAMTIVGDIGRAYTVRNKAQYALDAALLGAVTTASTTPVEMEMHRLFNANFPQGYLGAMLNNIQVMQTPEGTYKAMATLEVPSMVIDALNADFTTLNVSAQVTQDQEVMQNRRLEVALVLDNSTSMAGSRLAGLKQAANDLANILFGNAQMLQNLTVSIVPYNNHVNIGSGHTNWVQIPHQASYNQYAASGDGYVSNRNRDRPSPNSFNDISDAPPLSEETRFRTPSSAGAGFDPTWPGLPKIAFALNSKPAVQAAINTLVANGDTRINVGLMWGWFTLSPQWAGIFDPDRPEIPAPADPLRDKVVVLMTDSVNSEYNGTCSTCSNDNVTTPIMCEAVKAQGIIIYSIGFGTAGQVNQPLLRNCATTPEHYFLAPTVEQLRTVFQQIADDVLLNVVRISQ